MLCTWTSKQVLHLPFAVRNHLLGISPCFSITGTKSAKINRKYIKRIKVLLYNAYFSVCDRKRWKNLFNHWIRWFRPANGVQNPILLVKIHNNLFQTLQRVMVYLGKKSLFLTRAMMVLSWFKIWTRGTFMLNLALLLVSILT